MRAVRVTELGGPESIEVVEIDEPSDDGVVVAETTKRRARSR